MRHDTHDDTSSPRDLAFEALIDAIATAKLTGEHSLYLYLEIGLQARENGTLGRLVMDLECGRPPMPHDHPAVVENVRGRVEAVLAGREF